MSPSVRSVHLLTTEPARERGLGLDRGGIPQSERLVDHGRPDDGGDHTQHDEGGELSHELVHMLAV